MKTLTLSESLNHKVSSVWEIISDLSRSDWVPGVDEIFLEGDTREFFMQGMGKIKEKVLLCDERNKVLKYSAIETPAEIKHHLACIELTESETGC
ncbi:uncharacterized protein METZ01_LOCUS308511, partial [marine metagenome]